MFNFPALTGIIEFAKKILDLGPPPAIENQVALRAWLLSLVAILEDLADLTEQFEMDDFAVATLQKMLNRQISWEIGYRLLVLVENRLTTDKMSGDEANALGEQLAQSLIDDDKAGIDPATLIGIITTVIQLIKFLRTLK